MLRRKILKYKCKFKFPIERVKQALDQEFKIVEDDRINKRLVGISFKEGENSKKNPTIVWTRDIVQPLYDNALVNNEDVVIIPYESPSEEEFLSIGFIREGDFMVLKEDNKTT